MTMFRDSIDLLQCNISLIRDIWEGGKIPDAVQMRIDGMEKAIEVLKNHEE